MAGDPFFTEAIGPRFTVEEVEQFITERNGSLLCRECSQADQYVESSLSDKTLAFLGGLLSPDQEEVELVVVTACPHCGTARSISASVVATWRGTRA